MTKIELEDILQELEKHKGRQTELITVYVPAGQNIYTVVNQLEAEKSTAKNIKSTATRKNVSDALDKVARHLKKFKQTPENGLAIFCGNISKVEGQQDLQLWEVIPPMPLKIRIYRCDKEFVLQPLREMMEVDEVFALLVMDRKEAAIGLLEGKRIELLHKMTSGIPSKVRAGGQCLSPETLVYLKNGASKEISDIKIGEEIKALDIKKDKIVFTKVKNKWIVKKEKYLEIIISDCWSVFASVDHTFFKDIGDKDFNIVEVLAGDLKKEDFLIVPYGGSRLYYKGDTDSDYPIENIKEHKKSMEMIDIETENGNFFAEGFLVHNSSQRFHRITEGLTKEFYKRIAGEMKKIFFEMPKLKGILIGGPIPTKDEFLEGDYLPTKLREKVIGILDIGDADESGLKELVAKAKDILASQEIMKEKKLLEKFFETLGEKPNFAAYGEKDVKKALEYGAVDFLILSKKTDKKIARELKEMAENTSSKIEVVSLETTEGEQFYNLSGIGALLRFAIK